MSLGRPNQLTRGQHNAPLPDKDSSTIGMPFEWKYKFCGEGIQALMAYALSVEVLPTFEATMNLDKKLRGYDSILDPKFLRAMNTMTSGKPQHVGSWSPLQLQFVSLLREATLLNLHRGFFARAVNHQKGDPIESKWSISVMAA